MRIGRLGLIGLAAVLLVGIGAVAQWPGQAPAEQPASTRILRAAQLSNTPVGESHPVSLPDTRALAPGEATPLHLTYRIELPIAAAAHDAALFLPGLAAHARIAVNGHELRNDLQRAAQPAPRSADSILLVAVPDAFWKAGGNVVELEAAAHRRISVSTLEVGPRSLLEARQRARIIGVVAGPGVVAAVVGALGICMLFLWRLLREPLHGYFGAGCTGWALHSAWTVSPWTPLQGEHLTVWWHALYTFFVAMLVIFCARLAGWRWPRFERALWVATLCGPPLLYVCAAFDTLNRATDLCRLGLIGMVALGATANCVSALRLRGADSLSVAFTGVVCLIFAAHDWLIDQRGDDNNPVFWVPYAGLLFVAVMMRMLITRLVDAAREIRDMNANLERRVAAQNTELREALVTMKNARDLAEAADRAKTRFIATASHDLRQPAHALGLYMAALRAQRLGAGQADLLQRMSDSLAALDTMFHALLDISRFDAGAVVPRQANFPITDLLRRLAEEFAPQAEQRGLRLSLHLPPWPDAARVIGDPFLVERIVRNLLANAVKYTRQGGILLACRARSAGSAPRMPGARAPAACWRIEVWDTGIGIARQDQARVFEEFFQVDNAARERSRGLGLGLAIVSRLARSMDLALELRSAPGRGSCFAVRLPIGPESPAAGGCAEPLPALQRGAGASRLDGLGVAVLDDDVQVRDATVRLLSHWGCHVAAAACTAELRLQLDSRAAPHALIVDYQLDGSRTGPDEARALFAQWGLAVPLLVVTGESLPERLREMAEAGFECIAKPLDPALLRAWLQRVWLGGASAPGPVRVGELPATVADALEDGR